MTLANSVARKITIATLIIIAVEVLLIFLCSYLSQNSNENSARIIALASSVIWFGILINPGVFLTLLTIDVTIDLTGLHNIRNQLFNGYITRWYWFVAMGVISLHTAILLRTVVFSPYLLFDKQLTAFTALSALAYINYKIYKGEFISTVKSYIFTSLTLCTIIIFLEVFGSTAYWMKDYKFRVYVSRERGDQEYSFFPVDAFESVQLKKESEERRYQIKQFEDKERRYAETMNRILKAVKEHKITSDELRNDYSRYGITEEDIEIYEEVRSRPTLLQRIFDGQ